MPNSNTRSQFNAPLLRPAASDGEPPWAFVLLPKEASATLPRRGRTTVEGSINGHQFQATLEPDGQLSHWLKLSQRLLDAAGVAIGGTVSIEVVAVEKEPEPEVPTDLLGALEASPEAKATWDTTTTIARLDWVHWITSAKQAQTRAKRIGDACSMLASGNKRVCCFDSSGYYSKAFKPPEGS